MRTTPRASASLPRRQPAAEADKSVDIFSGKKSARCLAPTRRTGTIEGAAVATACVLQRIPARHLIGRQRAISANATCCTGSGSNLAARPTSILRKPNGLIRGYTHRSGVSLHSLWRTLLTASCVRRDPPAQPGSSEPGPLGLRAAPLLPSTRAAPSQRVWSTVRPKG
jgi:hypothetical protein